MTFKMQCSNAKTPHHIEMCVCVFASLETRSHYKWDHRQDNWVVNRFRFESNMLMRCSLFSISILDFFLTFRQICTHKTGNNLWPKWNASLILHRLIVDCYYLIAKCYADQHYYISEHAKKNSKLSHTYTPTHMGSMKGGHFYIRMRSYLCVFTEWKVE